MRSFGVALAPLMEGPAPDDALLLQEKKKRKGWGSALQWVKERIIEGGGQALSGSQKQQHLLLGVLACPLGPTPLCTVEPLSCLSVRNNPIEKSSAQYIVQQYMAAAGGVKVLSTLRNLYVRGKVRLRTSEFELAGEYGRNPARVGENGWFVLWQMMPGKWCVELAVGESCVQAGSDGRTVWRHAPWLGTHAAKGPIRPLRRALQGLDPMTTANVFLRAQCIGEKKMGDEECFILKIAADPFNLKQRSSGPIEIIRHVLFGYFSQRTGLLVYLEDSYLTRIEATAGAEAIYWETTVESSLEDYRLVDGICTCYKSHTVVTLFRFGEATMNHTRTQMEETCSVEEVAFNVPGLSAESFIPPAEIGNRTAWEEPGPFGFANEFG